jgi:hypothetical protein
MAWLMRKAAPSTETGAGKSGSNPKRLSGVARAVGRQCWASCVKGRSVQQKRHNVVGRHSWAAYDS